MDTSIITTFEWQRSYSTKATIVLILDYLGTFAFAISRIRLASGENTDLFGAYVIGLLTAVAEVQCVICSWG